MRLNLSGRPGRRSLALVALALSLLFVTAACGGKSETQLAADELAAGLTSHNAGNLADATTHYQACIKHEATNKYCLFDLGVIAQTQNQTSQAENYYRQALVTDPNYPPALFNLAILRTGLGDTQGAIALYKQYVVLTPSAAGGHLNLGLLLRASGDQAGAATELAAAIKLNPKLTIPPLASTEPSTAPSTEPSSGASAEPTAVPTEAPSAAAKTYTVVANDSLSSIAAKFGTTIEILTKLNNISASQPLHSGQVLILP